MTTKTLSKSDLAQFTGSENWYRHGINRNVLYTDGAQHVAEHGGAYWLLDEIAIIQPYNKAVAAEEFQVWKLAVRPDRTATLTCDDGNGNIVFTKEIEHNTPTFKLRRATSLKIKSNIKIKINGKIKVNINPDPRSRWRGSRRFSAGCRWTCWPSQHRNGVGNR